MKKFWDRIMRKRRIVVSSILMVVASVAIFLPQLLLKLPWFYGTEINGVELILDCAQIVSALFVIGGTIIAVWQYCLSSTKRMKELEFSRVEKAIELSNYYKDNILDRYSFVKRVFDYCGITSMIEPKRKTCELKEFDILELRQLYTDEEIEKFNNLKDDPSFVEAVVNLSSVYNIRLNGCRTVIEQNNKDNTAVVKISANQQQVVADFFRTYVTQTLNNAEYFAMAFTHNTADESVIYQSIYPTFLEMCFVMYYYISKQSDPSQSKLYTNIAQLYCVWREREQRQKQEHLEGVRKGSKSVGTVIDPQR